MFEAALPAHLCIHVQNAIAEPRFYNPTEEPYPDSQIRETIQNQFLPADPMKNHSETSKVVSSAAFNHAAADTVVSRNSNMDWLAAIIQHAADGILSIDTSGTILSCNRSAQELLSSSELIGQIQDILTDQL